jgi:hypothetical protein
VYFQAIQKSDGQQKQIRLLCEAFQQFGIDHMLLKGSRMKNLYPAPELRYMGDADILIRLEQYDSIVPVLQSMGFQFVHESDHELVWRHDQLFLELHKRLIPSYNKDFYDYYGDGWQLAVPGEGCEYVMKPEDEWIYLFTHFAKHYRDGGAGCRYIGDLWLWRRNYPDMDEIYIRDVLKKMHLEVFYDNILALLDYWFADAPGSEVLDVMTEFIFSSGSWGLAEIRVLSRSVRNAKHHDLGFSGRLQYLRQIAFPGVEVLRDKYRILKKAPWLLPVVWMARPFYKLFFEWRGFRKQMNNVQTLNRANMDLRQRMLELVGLDFNF